MDDKGSVGKISVSSDSVSTLNSEDFVLVSQLGDETPSSTNNGSDDEKTGLKVRMVGACIEAQRREGNLGCVHTTGKSNPKQLLKWHEILIFFFSFTSVLGHFHMWS